MALKTFKSYTKSTRGTVLVDRKNLWKGKYQGQKQKWYVMKFKGNERKDINLNISKAEFCDWKWINLNELESLIVSFK